MENEELIREKKELSERLAALPYTGKPVVQDEEDKKIIVLKKRKGCRIVLQPVGEYTEELMQQVCLSCEEAAAVKTRLKEIEKQLSAEA